MMETFVVKSGEIENRIDSHFFKPEFKKLVAALKQLNSMNLGRICDFSNETWNQKDIFDEYFPYIEINEIDTSTGEIKHISYPEKAKAPHRAKMIVRENDIIISTTRPHRGGIAFIDKSKDGFIASTGFAILRALKIDISREYLFYILRSKFCLNQMLQRSSGGNYPAITPDELKKIIIPIPSQKTQNKIVKIMALSYGSKKQKEAEADKLLGSIYDYAAKELNLNYNIKIRNSFIISSKKLNNRLDPLFYTIPLYDFLKTCPFQTTTIREVTDYIKSGFAAGKQDQDLTGKGITQIRPTNISEDREFLFEKNVYISPDKDSEKLVKGEVLFNNTNSQEQVGKTIVFDLDGDYFCSNHITRLKTNDEILPEFLELILNIYQKYGVFFRICTNWNNQSGVNSTLLETIKIPVPDVTEQKRLAKMINDRRKRAFQLREEAMQSLKEAKTKAERFLLGEGHGA